MDSADCGNDRPQRRHLRRLSEIYIEPAIFLVTICAQGRQAFLTNAALAQMIPDTLDDVATARHWRVGEYIIMPDHLHFFCTTEHDPHELSKFVGTFKSITTRNSWEAGLSGKLWQSEFHDHVLRTQESYAKKREYVRLNPVQAGLCEHADNWPFAGKIHEL